MRTWCPAIFVHPEIVCGKQRTVLEQGERPQQTGDQVVILPNFLTQDPDGFIHVTGHRVGLQHIIHYYQEGFSPEMLACEYPSLPLAEVHKVIAFYLENRADVERYIADCESLVDEQRRSVKAGPSIAELRQRLQTTRGMDGP